MIKKILRSLPRPVSTLKLGLGVCVCPCQATLLQCCVREQGFAKDGKVA